MPTPLVCCLAAAILSGAPTPARNHVPFVLAQVDAGKQNQQPQVRARGMSERQLLQNPLVQEILRDPDMQQQIMDDPRFEALMQEPQMQRLLQNPQVTRQLQQNQQLQQMYQLQQRRLPGVDSDDDN